MPKRRMRTIPRPKTRTTKRLKRTGRLKAAKRPPLLRSSRRAAHTHCFCGGSVNAGDHTSHQDVTYTACKTANSLRQIFNIEKVNVAYAYL